MHRAESHLTRVNKQLVVPLFEARHQDISFLCSLDLSPTQLMHTEQSCTVTFHAHDLISVWYHFLKRGSSISVFEHHLQHFPVVVDGVHL